MQHPLMKGKIGPDRQIGGGQLGSNSEHQSFKQIGSKQVSQNVNKNKLVQKSEVIGLSDKNVIEKVNPVFDNNITSTVSSLKLKMQLKAEQASGVNMPTQIYGYTKHGMNRVISRDGVGVSTESILKTWSNPSNIEYVPTKLGPSFRLTGFDSTIVINSEGKIITAWADNLLGVRLK